MVEQAVPPGIVIEVPEEYGDAYTRADGTRESVTRRQRIARWMWRRLSELDKTFTDDEAFEEACKIYSQIFTDWTLSGDDGPLPKPWQDPEAFNALVDSDVHLSLWVYGLIWKPLSELVEPEKN